MNDQEGNNIYNTDIVQNLLNREKTWSGMWLEYDRDKFNDDKNFEDVLDYVKNNSISLVKKRY